MLFSRLILVVISSVFLILFPVNAVRLLREGFADVGFRVVDVSMRFKEAPQYENGVECAKIIEETCLNLPCNPLFVHVAMTLDPDYIRGTIAAIHSVLKHTSCPENVFFHLIASDSGSVPPSRLSKVVFSAFPSLKFKVYVFNANRVNHLISSSIREALDNPLNYARIYLAEMLGPCINRVIYLDSDIIAVDDIQKLWRIPLAGSRTIGAPEYCHANFTNYFSNEFWSDPELARNFEGRRSSKPCYFNTGVMVMDLGRWRDGGFTREIEKWMRIQKERRIYELGSLPPFLLVFGGDVEAIDHRWNQHGLGGDNVVSNCRSLHPGPVSLLHWSGKGKPWRRLDANNPCPIDSIWSPYDLFIHSNHL